MNKDPEVFLCLGVRTILLVDDFQYFLSINASYLIKISSFCLTDLNMNTHAP